MAKGRSYCALKRKLIREESLTNAIMQPTTEILARIGGLISDERTVTEPDTLRGVSPVPGEGGENLS